MCVWWHDLLGTNQRPHIHFIMVDGWCSLQATTLGSCPRLDCPRHTAGCCWANRSHFFHSATGRQATMYLSRGGCGRKTKQYMGPTNMDLKRTFQCRCKLRGVPAQAWKNVEMSKNVSRPRRNNVKHFNNFQLLQILTLNPLNMDLKGGLRSIFAGLRSIFVKVENL